MASSKDKAEVSVLEINTGQINCNIMGTSPLICNRMSQKVGQELLMPKGRKNAAERAGTLKHDPLAEYRASPYIDENGSAESLIMVMSTAFKGALKSAALDIPGSTKAQMGRLTFIPNQYIHVYGVPEIFMAVTRSADMKRTPDIRTRAIIPKWACRLSVTFVKPILKEQAIVNLLAAAGITIGVGDWRPEKGSGSFGQFKLVSDNDEEFNAIIKSGGRAAQVKAMESPKPYDAETEELLSWFSAETQRRGFRSVS